MKKIVSFFLVLLLIASFSAFADEEKSIVTYEDLLWLEEYLESTEQFAQVEVSVVAKFNITDLQVREYKVYPEDLPNMYSMAKEKIYTCDMYIEKADRSLAEYAKGIRISTRFNDFFGKTGDDSFAIKAFEKCYECEVTFRYRKGDLNKGRLESYDIVLIEPLPEIVMARNIVCGSALGLSAILFYICLIKMIKREEKKKTIKANNEQRMLDQYAGGIIKTELVNVSTEMHEYTNINTGDALGRAWLGKSVAGDLGAIIGAATASRDTVVYEGEKTYTFIVWHKGYNGVYTTVENVKQDDRKFQILVSKLQ